MVDSDVSIVNEPRQSVYRTILLFSFALFGPFMFGFQYIEWTHSSSSHMTWFMGMGIGSFENSDWTDGVWILKSVFSSMGIDPFAVLGSVTILFLPRLLFAAAVSMYVADRLGRNYVVASALPVIAVIAFLFLQLMTANFILGTPPGVLISIVEPDIDSRFFLPIPILLVLGFINVKLKGST